MALRAWLTNLVAAGVTILCPATAISADIFASRDYVEIVDTLKGWGSAKPFQRDTTEYSSIVRVNGNEFFFTVPLDANDDRCTKMCNFSLEVCNSGLRKPTYEELNILNDKWWSKISWTEDGGTCLAYWVYTYAEMNTDGLDLILKTFVKELAEFRSDFGR